MENKEINIGIVGGAGYTGGELLRILLYHPHVNIVFVHSRSNAGKRVYEIHTDLIDETELQFSSTGSDNVDVLFLCVGHGEAKKFLEENSIPPSVKIIDLSQDFRLEKHENSFGRTFIYGLPELHRQNIISAYNIANPGCFATAIQLGLLPLAASRLLTNVYTTGITGSTGAGQSLSATSHFSWRSGNIQAYKTLTHQHLTEITQSLQQLQPSTPAEINFVPWRGDFTRGIFVSSQFTCDLTPKALIELYQNYYEAHPFVIISAEAVHLKQVINTNKCIVQVEQYGKKIAVHSVIDNLIKGASGQAVQNMNLMMGLPEEAGLKLKPTAF